MVLWVYVGSETCFCPLSETYLGKFFKRYVLAVNV